MTLSRTLYIRFGEAVVKGYLNFDAEEIYKKENTNNVVIETPVFTKEISFIVMGSVFNNCNCGKLDINDAEDNDWEHCPYCGCGIEESINEKYKTEEEAMKSEHYSSLGCIEYLLVTARSTKGKSVDGGLFT